jgi:hypothetical protein
MSLILFTKMTFKILQAHGGALTSEERAKIVRTAEDAKPVSTGNAYNDSGSKLVGESKYLRVGRPVDAVLGLDVLMNTSCGHQLYHQQLDKQEKGIEEEVRQFGDQKVLDILLYILDAEASKRGHDEGRENVALDYFVNHSSAQEAKLTRGEVVALRLYTTLAHSSINDPLRSKERCSDPCPLPATTRFAYDATKKLRALNAGASNCKNMVLWRGMRDLKVTDDFLAQGGTELGFMSTTRQVDVAVRYSLSSVERGQALLLFKILVPIFVSSGAELRWVSAFPREDEVLFPPLTFLQPTGRVDRLEAQRGGRQVHITVVEVVPHVG